MSWNEEEMIREMPVVNLTLDEAVEILAQLKGFDTSLYKDILHLNPEEDNVELSVKANLGMVVLNHRISKRIIEQIDEDLIEESDYYPCLKLMTIQSKMYESVIDHLYHEAKEQFENEE